MVLGPVRARPRGAGQPVRLAAARPLAGRPAAAYLITAEHDPLRDEGFAYADRLRDARVPVEHRHYGSQIHAFFSFTGVLDDADKAVSEAGTAIRAAVEPDSAGLAGRRLSYRLMLDS